MIEQVCMICFQHFYFEPGDDLPDVLFVCIDCEHSMDDLVDEMVTS